MKPSATQLFSTFMLPLTAVALIAAGSPSVPGKSKLTAPSPAAQASAGEIDRSVSSQAEAAQPPASYILDWQSLNGGGTIDGASPSYMVGVSAAQSAIGAGLSPSYQTGIGFWYGAGGGPPPACSCPCAKDPKCDGVISDVLDVVETVNRAFRGAPATIDPLCPYERTDVDCSGATDVIDVTHVVNVAFRSFSVASQYCDGCP